MIRVLIYSSPSTSVDYESFISLGNVRTRGILIAIEPANVDTHMKNASTKSTEQTTVMGLIISFKQRVKAFKEQEKLKAEPTDVS